MNASDEMQAKIDASMSARLLYDPPVDGKTPLNGSGLPSRSVITGDIEKKLALGFTLQPVGMEAPPPEPEPEPEPTPEPQPVKTANVRRRVTK
jgi:hypothetical protein